ncbi:MAG: DUF2267 domain-containing protein [Myxococcota bacterium]
MKTKPFLQSIRGRTGLDETAAMAAAEATLQTLGEIVPQKARKHIQKKLPEDLEAALTRGEAGQDFDLDTFYARVAKREGVAMGFGMEHAQAVCQALAEQLDNEDRVFIEKRLPEDFEVLFEAPEVKTVPPHEQTAPVSDREPPVEEPELSTESPGRPAQSGSVVNSPNPRGDRKLATGKSGPNEGHDLATGRAGASEGRDLATGVPPDHVPETGEDED